MKMMKTSEFHYSPSLNHQFLMQQMTPAYTFNGEKDSRWPNIHDWQKELRRKLRDLVGEMPTERTDLNVRHLWHRQHPLGTIEKIVFTSEPYVDVPAYVWMVKHSLWVRMPSQSKKWSSASSGFAGPSAPGINREVDKGI